MLNSFIPFPRITRTSYIPYLTTLFYKGNSNCGCGSIENFRNLLEAPALGFGQKEIYDDNLKPQKDTVNNIIAPLDSFHSNRVDEIIEKAGSLRAELENH